ncbi:MAG: hypothetical protein LBQ98_03875 [Nitrososphaerota archaeon]|jgi:predicted transcriptional regulator YdeE|nr:hypothetical protein [Nitrososphaerota archaeon]
MVYTLKQVTIRTNNTEKGMKEIDELWQDIFSGKMPILFDSNQAFQQGVSLVTKYSNYESDENRDYDLSIISVSPYFFQDLEIKVREGLYKKYDVTDETGDMVFCVKKAWEKVWNDKRTGVISRAYTEDYESIVPAQYAADKKTHCHLYIAVK